MKGSEELKTEILKRFLSSEEVKPYLSRLGICLDKFWVANATMENIITFLQDYCDPDCLRIMAVMQHVT